MSRFLQIHLLTPYHPSNLNRDDLGRPKTALVGGKQRLRISSQSLKRAWRTSEIFRELGQKHLGRRSRSFEKICFYPLVESGLEEQQAKEITERIMSAYKKEQKNAKKDKPKTKKAKEEEIKPDEDFKFGHLISFSHQEFAAVTSLVKTLCAEKRQPTGDELSALLQDTPDKGTLAVDVALFGRMVTDKTAYSIEAAMQVAHGFTVNEAPVEDDFFTAVDDLNEGDVGAGHMGETEFGSGIFYLYLCLNCDLLLKNLGGNRDLAKKALGSLVEAAATVAPTGKQNSFASRSVAHYILAERGQRQPRSLASAFFEPVGRPGRDEPHDPVSLAAHRMIRTCERLDKVYDELAESREVMDALEGKGSLARVRDFAEACA